MKRVYLDNNATTPLAPEVKQAIIESLDIYGNPSSHHYTGQQARKKIEEARAKIAELINASPEEIIFTSGASESNNIVLKSLLCSTQCRFKNSDRKKRIITTPIEHPSVLETINTLASEGVEVVFSPVDTHARILKDIFEKECRAGGTMASVMFANNEVGTIQDIKELAQIAHEHGLLFHTDAVQAAGKIKIDVQELGIDYLSLSGHKMYAPKGIGILYIKKNRYICPLICGGHQETGIRAGTENTIGIIAMGKAAELASSNEREVLRIKNMRDRLERTLLEKIPKTFVNGHPEKRVPNTLNMSFAHIEGESILYMLDYRGIEVSTGSACSSGSLEASHVLSSMCDDIERAHSSIRMSLGLQNTDEDIDYVISEFPPIVEKLRKISPLGQNG